MKKIPYILLIAAAACGCYKVDIYNTPHPDKGAVAVTTDWSNRSSVSVLPAKYVLRIGAEEQTVSDKKAVFQSLLAPGVHSLLAYNQASGMTVIGTTATVNTLDDGTTDPMPGYLFSAFQDLTIPKDDTLKVTMPMVQLIRDLTLTLALNSGDEGRIAGTTATLTGIAPSIDLTTGNINAAEGECVCPVFIITTSAPKNPVTRATGTPALTASLRLFGIMPAEKQELSIAVALTNGTVQTIKTDLTDYLKNFGSGELEPLVLDATLTLPPEVGVTATISDWNIVNNGNINVN